MCECISDVPPLKRARFSGNGLYLFHFSTLWEFLLACIIQPGAPRFERMRIERYVAVLLLSAGHASASPVVDQRWDLHLFVG